MDLRKLVAATWQEQQVGAIWRVFVAMEGRNERVCRVVEISLEQLSFARDTRKRSAGGVNATCRLGESGHASALFDRKLGSVDASAPEKAFDSAGLSPRD